MASQGEREPGAVGMDEGLLESMVQDGNPEQDIGVQEQFPPQTDPEPEMGAATAAVYDTSPPPLHQNPPILTESAQLSTPDMARLFAVLAQMEANTSIMENRMEANTSRMENGMEANLKENAKQMKEETNGMKDEMKEMRGEMRQVGRCLQAGKMATPRAATDELGGSATAVRPAVAVGEDRVIREMCWARSVKVMETVTQGGKLIGVTETCTSETRREVTELTKMREIEGRPHGGDGVGDAHTHAGSGGQWGRARRECWDPVQAAG